VNLFSSYTRRLIVPSLPLQPAVPARTNADQNLRVLFSFKKTSGKLLEYPNFGFVIKEVFQPNRLIFPFKNRVQMREPNIRGWCLRRCDIRHDDTQHNDTQHNDTQHNDTQHNDTHQNDTQNNDTQHNDTHHNDTQHKQY
jgi:hypothetical protein